MSDKKITIIGTVASVFGLLLTIYVAMSPKDKVTLLISLILFETIGLIIWIYFVRAKNLLTSPYEYENECVIFREVYESEGKSEMEIINVIRVTTAHLSMLPISVIWSGKGNLKISSDFSGQDIQYNYDGRSGKISFNYPISQSYKFGDTVVIHYRINCDDITGDGAPEMAFFARKPTRLCVLETILKYKETNPPAIFSYASEVGAITINTKIKDVNFDEKAKSYRVNIPNPTLNYAYKLTWVK